MNYPVTPFELAPLVHNAIVMKKHYNEFASFKKLVNNLVH